MTGTRRTSSSAIPALRPHRAFFEGLRGLDLAEQNAKIEREALRNIADHPLAYSENVVANVSRMLFNSPYSRTLQQTNDVFYAIPNAILLGAVGVLRAGSPPSQADASAGGRCLRGARGDRLRAPCARLGVSEDACSDRAAPRLAHRPLARRERPSQAGRSTRNTRPESKLVRSSGRPSSPGLCSCPSRSSIVWPPSVFTTTNVRARGSSV